MSLNIFISSLLDDFSGLKTILPSLKSELDPHNHMLVFVPSSLEYYEGSKEWEEALVLELEKNGLFFDVCKSLNQNDGVDVWKNSIQEASLIYLHGGNPLVQRELYDDYKISDLLRNFQGVLLGASAGAMNMSENIILTPTNDEYTDYVVKAGYKRAKVSIYPHINVQDSLVRFYETGDGVVDLNDILHLSQQTPIHLLADGQFIISKGAELTFLGDPHLIADKGHFYRNGVRVHLGWEHGSTTQLTHYEGPQSELVTYYDQEMSHFIDENVYHTEMKVLGSYEPTTFIKQVDTEEFVSFLILHPHLRSCQILIEKGEVIKETLHIKTVFTKYVEENKILPVIVEQIGLCYDIDEEKL